MRSWRRALASVLTGNLVYFGLFVRVLPEPLRHRPFEVDAGLLLDFALCLAIHLALGRWERSRGPGA